MATFAQHNFTLAHENDIVFDIVQVAQIDKLDTKLGKFEDSEIDRRKQLEVRVTAIERRLGLDNKIAA